MKRIAILSVITGFLFCISANRISGQATVYESHHAEIYSYLSRMAQKGLIEFADVIRPLSRNYIASRLDSLQSKTTLLSLTEKKELDFYRQEYRDAADTLLNGTRLIHKDIYGRWRGLASFNKDASIYADPIITAGIIQGDGKNVRRKSSGVQFWGRAGKHFAYYFFFNDVTESGKGFDTTRALSPETGIIRKDTSLRKSQNYTDFRGGLSYSWKNGSISFGQDYLLWGYGENGRIVLSDKAPSFLNLRLDYQPFRWLRFNYTHAWLNSKIIDSNRSYPSGNNIFGGERQVYIPKYFATHSAIIQPVKGLDLAIGESIIYTDRFDAGYLFPIMFFKVYDNIVNNSTIQTGSNGQLFFQASARNMIRNTHLYSSIFVDEIRVGTMFNKVKRRNQLGYTIGASVTDLLLPYLTITAEYTRVTPFVYHNIFPPQDYTHHQFNMGDWVGNNFDRFIFSLRYTPIPKLKCQARYQTIRKGGNGTLAEQYFQQPQPPFLFGQLPTRNEVFLQASYEWINRLSLTGYYSHWNDAGKTWSLGVNYGL